MTIGKSGSKIFLAMALVMAMVFSAVVFMPSVTFAKTADNDDYRATYKFDVNYIAAEFGKYDMVELSSKKFRCKICGRTFSTGIMTAGHIRGEHNKWLIHRYYEKI